MKINPKAVQAYGKSLLFIVISLEVCLGLIYLAGIIFTGKAYPLFNMDGQMTLPSFLQAFQLLAISGIAFSLLIWRQKSSYPPSPVFCGTIALLFGYASVDEVFKIHLQLYRLLHTSHPKAWMPIYLAIGISTLVIFHRDFIAIWKFHQKAIAFVALGMGIFFLGGFCGEVFKTLILQPILFPIFQQGDFIPMFLEKSRVAVEETSELIGETLTIYGLCLFVAKRWQKATERAIA